MERSVRGGGRRAGAIALAEDEGRLWKRDAGAWGLGWLAGFELDHGPWPFSGVIVIASARRRLRSFTAKGLQSGTVDSGCGEGRLMDGAHGQL